MKDPDSYMKIHRLQPRCAVYPDSDAVIDEAHREFVNYEIFYFSSKRARKMFSDDPLRYCGILTDPVSGVRFKPDKKSPTMEYGDRRYYFKSKITHKTFAASPDRYAFRHSK